MISIFAQAWSWQPVSSPIQIVAGTAVLGILAVFAYVRTMAGRPVTASLLLLLRLVFVVAVGVLLMGPSRLPPQTSQLTRPRLMMLLDTSESMLTMDCEQSSRVRFAVQQLLDSTTLGKLAQDYRVELQGFDEKLRPLTTEQLAADDLALATGKSTYLSDGVKAALAQFSTLDEGAALCVISDGRDTQDASIQPAAELARTRKVPVFSIGLGGAAQQRDAALLAIPMQEYLLPNEPGAILCKIYQSGMGDASTVLKLTQGGRTESIPIDFNHKPMVEVQVPIRQSEAGHYEYEISITPVSGEKESTNNSQIVFCDVYKKRIRILMLEGRPYWDSKFLAQSLRKDDRVELTQITQVSARKKETIVTRVDSGTPKVPSSQADWNQYDIVILGQSLEHVLDRQAAGQLQSYVSDHGGHLIFSRGRPYQIDSPAGAELAAELSEVEPVVWKEGQLKNVALSLTPSGRTSPWFSVSKMNVNPDEALSRLPGIETLSLTDREKPATVILANGTVHGAANAGSGETYPAIVRMNYGRGMVVAILGDGLWQWSLLAPEKQDLNGFYDTFWSNLVRWLAMGGEFPPGQQVALQLDRTSVRLGSGVLADVVYKLPSGAAPPSLTLTQPDGQQRSIAMGAVAGRESRFRAQLAPESTGVFRLTLNSPGSDPVPLERRFSVYDINLERLQAAANPLPLRILADHSGGAFFDAETARELPDRLRRQRTSMLVPPRLEYIWDNGVVMFVLLAWIGCEWLLRRMAGLL